MKTINVWIAVSAYGHPAPFLGWAFQRKALHLKPGYRAVKAQLVVP